MKADKNYEDAYRYALRLTKAPAQAEDLVQESVTKLLAKGYDANNRKLLFVVVRNTFISECRKTPTVELSETIPAPASSGDPMSETFSASMGKALETLPEVQRDAFLSYVEGDTYEEIAKAYNVPRNTIGVWIYRARQALAVALADWR